MKNIIGLRINTLLRKFEESTTKIFLFGTSFTLLLLSQAIFLASIKSFRLMPVLIACVISFIISIIFLYLIRKCSHSLPKISLPLILILLVVSIILISYPHDNFGGTDNGTYINLAFYLTNNGSFETPPYLNGLGGSIEAAKSSKPAYRIWLATQKILLGPSAAIRGNLLLIIFGLMAFFSVSSLLKDRKMGLMSIVLFATTMPFLWFSRETMTENLAFFLLWTAFLFFIVLLKTKCIAFFVYLILAVALLCFTRPEGIFIFFFTLFTLLIFAAHKKLFSRKLLLVIITSFLLLFILYFSSYQSAYTETTLSVTRSVLSDIKFFFTGKPFLLHKYPLFFVQMLIKYNFFLAVAFIFVVIFQLLFSPKKRNSNNVYFLALVLIIIPEFYKLINPNIQMLQPWFYRRYLYALMPLGYLSLSFFLSNLKNKRNSIIIFCLFLIINLSLSYPIIFLKHNWTLYEAMNKITKIVSSDDLVIIKNDRILDYYHPWYYLVMQKSIRAIYAFNIIDNNLSIEQKTYKGFPFNRLYYLSDIPNDYYKHFMIINKQSIDVNFSQLKPSCELQFMAYENNFKDFSLIPYSTALSYCKYPKNDIVRFKKQLYLYQLN